MKSLLKRTDLLGDAVLVVAMLLVLYALLGRTGAYRLGWAPANQASAGEQKQDKPMPDFTLADLDGKGHTLSEYRGRAALFFVWSSLCHLQHVQSWLPQPRMHCGLLHRGV